MEFSSHTRPRRPSHAGRQPHHDIGAYDRDRELIGLVRLWPAQIADTGTAGRMRVLSLLRRALRSERRRGLSGHWSYDLARHHQLLRAYRAEVQAVMRSAGVAAADRAHPKRARKS